MVKRTSFSQAFIEFDRDSIVHIAVHSKSIAEIKILHLKFLINIYRVRLKMAVAALLNSHWKVRIFYKKRSMRQKRWRSKKTVEKINRKLNAHLAKLDCVSSWFSSFYAHKQSCVIVFIGLWSLIYLFVYTFTHSLCYILGSCSFFSDHLLSITINDDSFCYQPIWWAGHKLLNIHVLLIDVLISQISTQIFETEMEVSSYRERGWCEWKRRKWNVLQKFLWIEYYGNVEYCREYSVHLLNLTIHRIMGQYC